ncbi:hypothetical protein SLEP1_g19782 [Rubroshorea leprosula]|uniref:Uncharacterized protein n=1 Tax=Rubroshorea leprosula TaxID=152421 RepID=A0AAV5J6H1_9ROSI|nr:hypothetical protein SLEP1_g19782 [Rubroshorea leprosula]
MAIDNTAIARFCFGNRRRPSDSEQHRRQGQELTEFRPCVRDRSCGWSRGSCVARFLGRFYFQPMKENPLLGPSSSSVLQHC